MGLILELFERVIFLITKKNFISSIVVSLCIQIFKEGYFELVLDKKLDKIFLYIFELTSNNSVLSNLLLK